MLITIYATARAGHRLPRVAAASSSESITGYVLAGRFVEKAFGGPTPGTVVVRVGQPSS
ncbi:hypothetical protein AB0J28_13040 [Streptosporangium canum]|uniref:hypothetical protein n=1 Tax=Streptosporangium canum TaxID=324952 RepID=UPI00342F4062